jgi:hypothetical protein
MSRHRRLRERPYDVVEPVLIPANDSAVRDLLDHVAEELAKEYVRLMQEGILTGPNVEMEERKRHESRGIRPIQLRKPAP